eukprot:scaffold1697_cov120-Cylindrotheca_fusiformis.AAC.56
MISDRCSVVGVRFVTGHCCSQISLVTAVSSSRVPKPSYDSQKRHVASMGAESLNSMLHFRDLPLVSPDYPPRSSIRSLPANETLFTGDGSLSAAKKALKFAMGASFPREHPVLAPRPGSAIETPPIPFVPKTKKSMGPSGGPRLNKFVRRLHDMLQAEKNCGLVEWRKGLLVLHSTDSFAMELLPKYFKTQNFKTFRRQLNYYGFVHVRSFSTTGASTTALWVNRTLAKDGIDDISAVLNLKRVEPCEGAKTAEGRRHRKELALSTVEDDIGVSAKALQLEQIRSMALRDDDMSDLGPRSVLCRRPNHSIPHEVHVPCDMSASNTSGSCSEEDFFSTNAAVLNDRASETAANVLLMLSRA